MNFKEWLKLQETEVVMGTKPKLPKGREFNVWGAAGAKAGTKVIDGDPIKNCNCK